MTAGGGLEKSKAAPSKYNEGESVDDIGKPESRGLVIDAHCHLDEIPDYTPEKGVLPIACGHSHTANKKTAALARKWNVPFVLGIAPQTAQKEGADRLGEWMDAIRKEQPAAIGEIGLDYHWAKENTQKRIQQHVFDAMLDLAEEMKLPIVLHCRESGDAMMDMLETRNVHGAMWHFFSGSKNQAERALAQRIYLSFPPLPSKARTDALQMAPAHQIVVETDAPIGGKTPHEVVRAVEYVARVKEEAVETMARQTAKNAARLFGLDLKAME